MTTPIHWWQPSFGEREREYVCAVIESGFVNDGKRTREFEQKIASLCGVPHAIAVTNCTSAMFLALRAVGVGGGDEVIVPDLTFIATANAVRLAGATPLFVDVREDGGMDPDAVSAAITSHTKAVIPVHISGHPADMDALLALAHKHNLTVIEDAAEALGSALRGTPLGSVGDVGCFSFSPMKTITTGQGGIAVTKNAAIAQRLIELKDQGRPVRGTGGDDEHVSLGYNFKFTDLQAAVGLAQLESIAERLEHQRSLYRWYAEELSDVPGITLRPFALEDGEVPQWIDAVLPKGRDALHDHLLAHNMHCRKFWHPLHTQAPYKKEDDLFPMSTKVSYSSLWLPSALALTQEDIRAVCHCVREWSDTCS